MTKVKRNRALCVDSELNVNSYDDVESQKQVKPRLPAEPQTSNTTRSTVSLFQKYGVY